LAVQLDKRKLSSAADRFASLRSGVRYRETNMGRKELLILSALIVGFGAYAEAQTVISPSRMIDWSNAGVPGGIPTRATICATLNAGATATSINNAIAACPSGQVVFLNAGTYNLSTGIIFNAKNNVTLRGAGPNQ